MFTLLTEADSRVVIREYRMRVVVVALLFLIIALLLGLILLMPSFVLISGREKLATEKLATVLTTQEKLLAGNPDENARETKEIMRLLSTRSKQSSVSELFDRVSAHRFSGVRITSLTASINENNMPAIGVSGVASTRQALSAFVKTLEVDKAFTGVSVPVSNFAKSTNLEFTLSLIYTPPAL